MDSLPPSSTGLHLPVLQSTGGCEQCHYRLDKLCAGLPLADAKQGCLVRCGVTCGPTCDWTCPNRPHFTKRLGQLGSPFRLDALVRSPLEHPETNYIPTVHHGNSRVGDLCEAWTATPLHKILWPHKHSMHPIARTRDGLLERLRIGRTTKLIVTGVAQDPYLEKLWNFEESVEIATWLRSIGVHAVTAPNYSSFPDAPRIHNAWNRLRMLKLIAWWSEFGVPVIPHVQIADDCELDWWVAYLKNHPEITALAREFQTGNGARKNAHRALEDMELLPQLVGRPLHFYVIGAMKHIRVLKARLASWTMIDSKPFMSTMHREELTSPQDGSQWVAKSTEEAEPLDERLSVNIRRRHEAIDAALPEAPRSKRQYLLRVATVADELPSAVALEQPDQAKITKGTSR